MRKSVAILATAVMLGTTPVFADEGKTDEKYKTISAQLIAKAEAALSAGDFEGAEALYQQALVANPGSVSAYRGLGQVFEGLDRTGRSLRFYRKALEVEPNDLKALELQALAFLKKDLIDRATLNRSRLARLCNQGCDELDKVEMAIETWHTRVETADQVAENNTPG